MLSLSRSSQCWKLGGIAGLVVLIPLIAHDCVAQHRWTPLGGEWFTASAFDGQNFWLGSQDGKLLESPDGFRWQFIPQLLANIHALGVAPNGRLLAAGAGIEASDNGGVTWHSINNGMPSGFYAYGLNFLGKDTILVCGGFGSKGALLRSTDAGGEWQDMVLPDTSVLLALSFVNDSVGYCSTDGGAVLKTEDAGNSWQREVLPGAGTAQVNSVTTIGDSIALAGTNNGQLFRSSDAGLTWNILRWDTAYPDFFLDPSNFFFFQGRLLVIGNAGSNNFTFESNDSGKEWHLIFDSITLPPVVLETSTVRGDGTGIRAGFLGMIQRTTDGGKHWSTTAQSVVHFEPYIITNLNTVTFTDSSTGYVFGDNGREMKTIDGGITWETHLIWRDTQPRPNLHDAHFFMKDSGIVIGDGIFAAYFSTTDAGESWLANHAFDGKHLTSISLARKDRLFMTGDSQLYLSLDHGAHWQIDSQFRDGWRPYRIKFLSQDTGYLLANWENFPVSILTILWTTDAGLTWREMYHDSIPWLEGPLQVCSPSELYFSYPGGAILHTLNAGASWDTIHLPVPGGAFNRLVEDMLMISDSVGFAIGQNLSILSTTDGWRTSSLDSVPHVGSDSSNLTLFRIIKNGRELFVVGQENIYMLGLTSAPISSVSNFRPDETLPLAVTVSPNPFRDRTSISYNLPSPAKVTISLYDATGAEVMRILNHYETAGIYTQDLDASALRAGTYNAQVEAKGKDGTIIRQWIGLSIFR